MKQRCRAQKFISPHWWTSVIWRMTILAQVLHPLTPGESFRARRGACWISREPGTEERGVGAWTWSWRRQVRVDSVTVRLPAPRVLLLCVCSNGERCYTPYGQCSCVFAHGACSWNGNQVSWSASCCGIRVSCRTAHHRTTCWRLRAAWRGQYYPSGTCTCRHPAWSHTYSCAWCHLHCTSTVDRARHLCNISANGKWASNFSKRWLDQRQWRKPWGLHLVVTHDGPLPVIGYVAPTTPAPVIIFHHWTSSWHLLLVHPMTDLVQKLTTSPGAWTTSRNRASITHWYQILKVELQLYDNQEVTDECGQCTRWPAAKAATAVRCFQLFSFEKKIRFLRRAPPWHDHVFKDWRMHGVETPSPNVSVVHDFQHDIPLLVVFLLNIRGRSSLTQSTSSVVLVKGNCPGLYWEHVLLWFWLRHRAPSILYKEKTHAFPDDNIIIDGAKRFRCVEMLFQPVSLAADFTAPLHHEGWRWQLQEYTRLCRVRVTRPSSKGLVSTGQAPRRYIITPAPDFPLRRNIDPASVLGNEAKGFHDIFSCHEMWR